MRSTLGMNKDMAGRRMAAAMKALCTLESAMILARAFQ